jgi:hypothetical protein
MTHRARRSIAPPAQPTAARSVAGTLGQILVLSAAVAALDAAVAGVTLYAALAAFATGTAMLWQSQAVHVAPRGAQE